MKRKRWEMKYAHRVMKRTKSSLDNCRDITGKFFSTGASFAFATIGND